jgi:hypothetical protein
MKKIILIAILAFGINSYSKSKIIDPIKGTKVIRKTEKKYSHGILKNEKIITYSYENDLVSKIVTTSEKGDTLVYDRMKYDNGKLKQMHSVYFPTKNNIKTVVTEVYNYTDDLITSVASSQNEFSYLRFYYYNSFKQIEKVKNIKDDNVESEGNYEYFSNGNISKIKFSYVKSSNNYSDRYRVYDDKNNSFELIFPSAYLKIHNLAKNNIISYRCGTIHYHCEYEYNANNYPIKITEKRSGGEKSIITIEYE